MKRTSRGSRAAAKRKAGRRPVKAKRAAPRKVKAAAPRRATAASPVVKRPARAAARKAPARKAAARPPLVRPPDGELQLADPVEAAQEDLRALPEEPLFDRDRSGRDDDLAELLGEEYVRSVTSGEEQGVELRDEPVPEEEGGPFVESSGQKEFANDEDDSEPEALPTTRARPTRNIR